MQEHPAESVGPILRPDPALRRQYATPQLTCWGPISQATRATDGSVTDDIVSGFLPT